MKILNRYTPAQLLVAATMGILAVRYMGAFVTADLGQMSGILSEVFSVLIGLTGLAMGILDGLGGLYLFDGLRRALPKPGATIRSHILFWLQVCFTAALILSSLAIMVPFSVSRMSGIRLYDLLQSYNLEWIWQTLVNLAPVLIVGGTVMGHGGIVPATAAKQTTVPSGVPETTRNVSGTGDSSKGGRKRLSASQMPCHNTLIKFYVENPGIGPSELSGLAQVSKTTCYRWLERKREEDQQGSGNKTGAS